MRILSLMSLIQKLDKKLNEMIEFQRLRSIIDPLPKQKRQV